MGSGLESADLLSDDLTAECSMSGAFLLELGSLCLS